MKAQRVKIMMMAVFVLTLGAGVVAGLLASRMPATPATPTVTGEGESSLAEELQLNPRQREQMRKIWEGVRDLSRESLDAAQKLQKERDTAIYSLVPPEKREQLNQIGRAYQEGAASLKGRRQAAFEKAVKETRQILTTESQREKYNGILKKRLGNEAGDAHDPAGDLPAWQPPSAHGIQGE